MEVQDRGSPHIHMILWTGKTADELLTIHDLVVAQIPHRSHDRELYELVTRLQIHRCGPYCLRDEQKRACRFRFPEASCSEARFEGRDKRTLYKRSPIDGMVNSYNPYILKLMKSSMDIQINSGDRVVGYLAKYMSKVGDDEVEMECHMQTTQEHFAARIVSSIDASFFIIGLHKH